MEQTLTLACKLQPTLEQTSKIEALLQAFKDWSVSLNGAINISLIGQSVTLPEGSRILSCSLQDVVLRATESLALKGEEVYSIVGSRVLVSGL